MRRTEPFSGAKGARTLEDVRPDVDCSAEAGVAPAKLRRSLDVVPVFGVVVEFRADAKELRDPRRESKGWRAPPPSDVRPAPCDARRAFHSSNCLRRSCAASFPLGSGARNDIACAARPALPQCFRENVRERSFSTSSTVPICSPAVSRSLQCRAVPADKPQNPPVVSPGVADFLVFVRPRNVGLESVPRAHLRVHARRPTMAMTAEEVRYPDIYLEASVPVQRRSPEKSERGDPSFARYFDIRGGSSGETRGQGQSASTSGATALAAQVKELQVRCIRSHADERWLVRRRLAFQPTPFSSLFYFPACSTDVLHAPDPPERALTVSSQTPKTVKQAKLTEKTNELEAIKVRAPPRRLRSTPYACATPPLALSFTSGGPRVSSDRPLNFFPFPFSSARRRRETS